jgi:hypothetical protein
MVATRGMRASERKRPMKSWRTVSYTGSVIRYKRIIRAQVTKLLHTLFQSFHQVQRPENPHHAVNIRFAVHGICQPRILG